LQLIGTSTPATHIRTQRSESDGKDEGFAFSDLQGRHQVTLFVSLTLGQLQRRAEGGAYRPRTDTFRYRQHIFSL